jgi:hypothetical protein
MPQVADVMMTAVSDRAAQAKMIQQASRRRLNS